MKPNSTTTKDKITAIVKVQCNERMAEGLHIEKQRMIKLYDMVINMVGENLIEPYPSRVINKFDELIRGDFDNREIAFMGYVLGSFIENAARNSLEKYMNKTHDEVK
jgi:ribosomal protein S17E